MPDATHPTFDEALEAFIAWHRGNTKAAYMHDLRVLGQWCDKTGHDPFALRRTDIEAFLIHCETERGNCMKTLKRRLGTLRKFYELLVDDGVCDRNPAYVARIRRAYRPVDETDIIDLGLARHEMAGLLRAGVRAAPRDAALVALMGGLGLRVSEAVGLDIPNVRHFEDDHRVLRFIGKGYRLDVIPIPPQLWRVLATAIGDRDEGPVVIRANGTRSNRVAASRVITRLAKDAGIERHITPHDLRRGYVSGLFDAGATLRQAQTAARHADPRMTALYDRRRKSLDHSPLYQYASWLSAG